MKVLIIDDEPVMGLVIERMLMPFDDIEVVANLSDVTAAIAFVEQNEVDLAFVDIQIGDDSGLMLARTWREMNAKLDIVFVTSHRGFALDAYEIYPLDYIVKPVSRQRLIQTLDMAREKRSNNLEELVSTIQPNRLSVQALGSMRVNGSAGEVKWMSRKSRELFAYLVMHKGRGVSRGQILDDVFANRSMKSAEAYLYTAIYQMRQALEPHGMKDIVMTAQEQYRLELERLDVDYIEFERQVADMSSIDADHITAMMELEQRYTGYLFEDKDYEWSIAERGRLEIIYESFVKRLANRLVEHQRYQDAELLVRRALSFNELDEELNVMMLRIYSLLNKRQLLSIHYDHYKTLLHRELNMPPSDECTSIYEQSHQ
jgi:two-component SAPR family response regulator